VCAAGLVLTPAASAAGLSAPPLGLSILGIHIGIHIPSVGDIVKAIVNLFFGTLANALVPGFLRHATVSVIQHLVAVPDPAAWPNVGRLVSDMIYLAVSLLPVMLAVAVLRYWAMGFTGAAHPATALVRTVAVVAALVLYRWGIGQLVGLVNVLTHAILGFPAVANGLGRIVGVMFGGALLTGVGGVFGAILVIVGVVFAAALYAAQVLVMLMFAVLFVMGPPLLALAVLPETAHLARTWFHVLVGLAMVPLGWTVLFATAGALTLDATDFTAGTGGLPSTFAAAFAALITFVLAARLPLLVLGELRHLARSGSLHATAHGTGAATAAQGSARVVAARERLRRGAVDGTMSLGRSVGAAAGALGAPRGGPLGAAGRAGASMARRSGVVRAAPAVAVATAAGAGAVGGRVAGSRVGGSRVGRAVGERFGRAGAILAAAPSNARAAVARTTTSRTRRSRAPARPASSASGSATAEPRPSAASQPAAAGHSRATERPDPARGPVAPAPAPPAPRAPTRQTPAGATGTVSSGPGRSGQGRRPPSPRTRPAPPPSPPRAGETRQPATGKVKRPLAPPAAPQPPTPRSSRSAPPAPPNSPESAARPPRRAPSIPPPQVTPRAQGSTPAPRRPPSSRRRKGPEGPRSPRGEGA
jgi:hypothetical protein